MEQQEEKVADLLEQYQEIFGRLQEPHKAPWENPYGWAVRKKSNPEELVKCTIPFVGKEYFQQNKKILVYASAENLSYYYNSNEPSELLDKDENALNRHRRCFEQSCVKESIPFFPSVHLAPMTNGCLATAVYYIAAKLVPVLPQNPYAFEETIAFGNYGKFSIKGPKNCDYAKNPDKLAVSHEFIKADLDTLKPDYIIMPKSIYEADCAWINANKGKAVVIHIYQLNARVVNAHIAGKAKKKEAPLPIVGGPLQEWCEHVSEVNKENYKYVFPYLDDVLAKMIKQNGI